MQAQVRDYLHKRLGQTKGDAGGLQDFRYVGGLALGLVFGPRAAETAIGATKTLHREVANNG